MRRSTSVRRACAVGTTVALIGLTTGLGIMTATSASAVEADPTTTSTGTAQSPTANADDAGSTPVTPTPVSTDEPSAPATGDASDPSGAPSTGDAGNAPAGDGSTTGDPGTAAGSGSTTDGSAPAESTTPPAVSPTPDVQPTASPRASAVQTVTIEGDVTVGSDLVAKQAGFTSGSKTSFAWTDESGNVIGDTASYTIEPALAGQRITVTVTGEVAGETATATTDTAVPPVFVDAAGKPLSDDDTDPTYEVTAGEAFSYTFRAQSTPAPTLTAQWFDDEGDPDAKAPAGVSFDAETGVLSGKLTEAYSYYSLVITATATTPSGPVSSSQYVDIDVQAGAPVGIEVVSFDKGVLDGKTSTAWIIHPNGDVYSGDVLSDDEPVKGGQVTVAQGGTLLVRGAPVDQYGNEIQPDFNEETGEPVFFTPTVTSNVASDVVKAGVDDTDLGDVGFVSVTFPHASTHTLTVSGDSLASTSFAVEVVPTAVPVQPIVPAAVHHATTGRQLAYTGTDATGALPWALGFVLAGLGLIGARTLRRRQHQR